MPEVGTEILRRLLESALQYAESQDAEYVRATTPALEPYVTTYKQAGFSPLRRDFRIAWDLDALDYEGSSFKIRELQSEMVGRAAESCVESLHPWWDWRTEEHGGPSAMAHSFEDGMKRGEKWLACQVENRMVGLAGLNPDYGKATARFRGAYVLPSYRGRGIGSALMKEIMKLARQLGKRRTVVYTFSYLDRLAPGASLYLKSGGKIEAEYLQLQMK